MYQEKIHDKLNVGFCKGHGTYFATINFEEFREIAEIVL